jgi:glucokinase
MTGQNSAPVLAVDIGGTKIMTALISPEGKMLAGEVCPTLVGEGVPAVIERLFSAIDGLLDRNQLQPSQITGISIACAGGVDTGRGMIVTPSPNMPGWADVPLVEKARERYQVQAFLLNDASAAALGEHRYGAGRGVNNLVLFTLGTGIGGGVIADGELYLGAIGSAAEIGHMTIDADGPECGCGNKGCLETLASGTAVTKDAVRRISCGEKTSIMDTVGGDVDKITAETVAAAARNGDELALEVLNKAGYYLGIGMINMVNIFNPDIIVLGGGMAELGDLFIGQGRKMVAERAWPMSARSVRIVTAQLGNEAGVYGAAAYAFGKAGRKD